MPEDISDKTTTRNCWQLFSKNVSTDTYNSVLNNWTATVRDLRETPCSWIKWMAKLEKPRLKIIFDKDVSITTDPVENWTNSVGVKESAKILRDQEEMTGDYLLNNNLGQANMASSLVNAARRIISALANVTSQIEVISDKTTARSFIQNYWQRLSKVVSTYISVLENWAATVEYLREIPGSWIKWNMTKLVEERTFHITGLLIVQSLRDLVCYVVDLSEVPKCGSFNPYGNEQMSLQCHNCQRIIYVPSNSNNHFGKTLLYPNCSELDNYSECVHRYFEFRQC